MDDAMDARQIRLLGPVDLLVDGGSRAVPGRTLQTLLAVLSLRTGEVVAADLLADELWGDRPPSTAANTLQRHVSSLRALLGGLATITAQPPGYVLVPIRGQAEITDVVVADRLVHEAATTADLEARVAALRDALSLWRGNPLAGVADDGFLSGRAAALARQRMFVHRAWVRARIALGEGVELLAELHDLIVQEPYDEELHGGLMVALYRAGRQAEALAVARNLRASLADDLGIDPGAAIRDLEAAILRQDPSLTPGSWAPPGPSLREPARAPAQLPVGVAGFTGRHDEIAELDTHVDAARARVEESVSTPEPAGGTVVSVLHGTAGIGKTALAVHWAHRVAPRYPDGQLYANLRGFDPRRAPTPPADVLRGFLEALGTPADQVSDEVDALAAQFRTLLAGRRVLLLLDNARDAEQVRPLLPGAGGCVAVVTSRTPLASLAAAEGAHLVALDLLDPAEARDVLVQRLGAARVEEDGDALRDIVAACAGLPLALAVVAGRAASRRTLPLTVVAAELRTTARLLDALRGEDETTDVRTVISCSYGALSPRATRMFRLLGLHPGPDLSAPAAASLAGLSATEGQEVLDELVRAALVGVDTSGRLAIHDLLRAYAAERAQEDPGPARERARHRLLDHYLHTAHAAALHLGPLMESIEVPDPSPGVRPESVASQHEASAWFRSESAVLMAALDDAASQGLDRHAWQLAWCLDTYLHRSGRWRDQVRIHTVGLEAARAAGDVRGTASISRLLARALWQLGEWDSAETLAGEALRVYELLHDDRQRAHSLIYLGSLAGRRGRLAEALAHTREALQLSAVVKDPLARRIALANLACGYHESGDPERGIRYGLAALRACEGADDPETELAVRLTLGDLHRDSGEADLATACYGRAADLAHSVGDVAERATALRRLGEVHHARGDVAAAASTWGEALRILTALDHPTAEELRTSLQRLCLPVGV
jgi:DNA-binding SARP family transcriptional activator/tetratricopeptide (TPR) repeat protein